MEEITLSNVAFSKYNMNITKFTCSQLRHFVSNNCALERSRSNFGHTLRGKNQANLAGVAPEVNLGERTLHMPLLSVNKAAHSLVSE